MGLRKKKSEHGSENPPDFMDAHMLPEENPSDHLNRLIGDHKKLFDQYTLYTREHDKIYTNYVLMIEALKQENEMLKLRLKCESSDPIEAKKTKQVNGVLQRILEEEECVVNEISAVLHQLNRDQLLIDKQSKIIMEKKERLRVYLNELEATSSREKYLQEIEYKKYMSAVQLNLSIVENQKLRTTMDSIKCTRLRYELSFKNLLKEIQDIKEMKKVLLEEAQQFIEDKETTNSMIKGMLSGNKKESALYTQKIESMKQMIRYDTKATDFLVRKLNDRAELKAIDQINRKDELKEILDMEVKSLDKLKEEQDAIQDVTEEKEGELITKVYNQKEADKMALFNYIADLNGELINLKQQQHALIEETQNLKKEDASIREEFEATMAKNEAVYKRLSKEMEQCERNSVGVHAAMDVIKEFICCTFNMLNCSTESMEEKLGLDLDVNARNMPAYLVEIEHEASNLIQSTQYAEYMSNLRDRDSLTDSMALSLFKKHMVSFDPTVPRTSYDESLHVMKVAPGLVPNPVKDFPEYSMRSGADILLSSKQSLELAAQQNIKDRSDLLAKKKNAVKIKFGSIRSEPENN